MPADSCTAELNLVCRPKHRDVDSWRLMIIIYTSLIAGAILFDLVIRYLEEYHRGISRPCLISAKNVEVALKRRRYPMWHRILIGFARALKHWTYGILLTLSKPFVFAGCLVRPFLPPAWDDWLAQCRCPYSIVPDDWDHTGLEQEARRDEEEISPGPEAAEHIRRLVSRSGEAETDPLLPMRSYNGVYARHFWINLGTESLITPDGVTIAPGGVVPADAWLERLSLAIHKQDADDVRRSLRN